MVSAGWISRMSAPMSARRALTVFTMSITWATRGSGRSATRIQDGRGFRTDEDSGQTRIQDKDHRTHIPPSLPSPVRVPSTVARADLMKHNG
jgi:hypothetical protein